MKYKELNYIRNTFKSIDNIEGVEDYEIVVNYARYTDYRSVLKDFEVGLGDVRLQVLCKSPKSSLGDTIAWFCDEKMILWFRKLSLLGNKWKKTSETSHVIHGTYGKDEVIGMRENIFNFPESEEGGVGYCISKKGEQILRFHVRTIISDK